MSRYEIAINKPPPKGEKGPFKKFFKDGPRVYREHRETRVQGDTGVWVQGAVAGVAGDTGMRIQGVRALDQQEQLPPIHSVARWACFIVFFINGTKRASITYTSSEIIL